MAMIFLKKYCIMRILSPLDLLIMAQYEFYTNSRFWRNLSHLLFFKILSCLMLCILKTSFCFMRSYLAKLHVTNPCSASNPFLYFQPAVLCSNELILSIITSRLSMLSLLSYLKFCVFTGSANIVFNASLLILPTFL